MPTHRSISLNFLVMLQCSSWLLAHCCWLIGLGGHSQAADIDFGRDVRPILSDKCFLCHGPDAEHREADLRLDLRAEALETGAIQPGNADESEIVVRVTSDDQEHVMPPPESGKSLSKVEQEILRQWINAGAPYSEHWAFEPPTRPEVPLLAEQDESDHWPRGAIDRFIFAQMQSHHLTPATAASRATLIRRLYLDLIGLPPSPQELDRWLAVDASDDEQQLIRHLLDSPHFGERWGRWWLDAARYSDSDGYEKDKQRSVWFYRDWVIDAMNSDMGYDQFIIEQIAGDLLPNATQNQRVATGFLRNSMVNEEGGADPEQFRIEGMFDRMDAIGKSILGITTQCAQCHTHKYDPLSQREYYQMFAALNDFHEATITAFTPAQAQRRDEVLAQVAALEKEVLDAHPNWQTQVQQWEQQTLQSLIQWQVMRPTDIPFSGQKFRLLDDGSIVSESYAPTKTTDTFKLIATLDKITAIRLEALKHPQLPRGGPGRSIYGSGAVTEFEVTVTPVMDPKSARQVKFVRALSDANPPRSELPAAYREKDPSQDDRVTGPIEYAFDGDAKTAWSTDVGPGQRNQPRVAVFIPESPLTELGDVELSFSLKQNHGGWNSDDNQNYLLGRYRFSITDDQAATELTQETFLPLAVEQALLTPVARRTPAQQAEILSHWITRIAPDVRTAMEAVWQKFPETDTQLVVESRTEGPRETFVYTRGDFLRPGEAVAANAPAFLGSLPPTQEPDRLRFARWLVRPDAPTTARVIVNRMWQAYFGRGLVATPEDFGFQSSPPTHPQLLDWLAVELIEHGWSLKHIHRLIVNSATYRQSSTWTSESLERDPLNEYLSRGPRMRVDAELVRDVALSVSGLLNDQVGGPSVYPPAPDFLFQPPASYGPKIWNTNRDAQQYRRSVYVHSYRSVPYPALQVFDAPKGDAACIRRERSNTPLQALVLLNEPQFVECARAMAGRVLRESPADDDLARLQYAHRLATGRIPEQSETQVLQELLDQQRSRIAAAEISAEALLGVSPSLYQQLSGREAQAAVPWMIVCRVLLNLDETITK
ncbi:MAG: PSD1 and planctomycete cytochrome C domain-containing protein [Pirellulaceae bacterium]